MPRIPAAFVVAWDSGRQRATFYRRDYASVVAFMQAAVAEKRCHHDGEIARAGREARP